MNVEQFERAIKYAVKRIVDTLESWNEPWLADDHQSPEDAHAAVMEHALGFRPSERGVRMMQSWVPGVDIDDDPIGDAARSTVIDCGGAALAKNVLATLMIDEDESSPLFRDLSLEMGKLTVTLRRVLVARSKGDYSAEARFVDYYRQRGYAPTAQESAAATTPTISEAWQTYSAEKLSGPRPAWGTNTAKKQAATFADFLDIVGNLRVGEITRDTMLRFRAVLAKLSETLPLIIS
jgi:hypothetical protein